MFGLGESYLHDVFLYVSSGELSFYDVLMMLSLGESSFYIVVFLTFVSANLPGGVVTVPLAPRTFWGDAPGGRPGDHPQHSLRNLDLKALEHILGVGGPPGTYIYYRFKGPGTYIGGWGDGPGGTPWNIYLI